MLSMSSSPTVLSTQRRATRRPISLSRRTRWSRRTMFTRVVPSRYALASLPTASRDLHPKRSLVWSDPSRQESCCVLVVHPTLTTSPSLALFLARRQLQPSFLAAVLPVLLLVLLRLRLSQPRALAAVQHARHLPSSTTSCCRCSRRATSTPLQSSVRVCD